MGASLKSKVAAIIGFLSLGLGSTIAYLSPATGYELSIYSGTPILFWVCVSVSLSIALVLTFDISGLTSRGLGILLGGISMTSIVSLPLIRGYFWVGGGDALSHLGWTRDLYRGIIGPADFRYPAVHTLGSVVSHLSGFEVRYALLLFIPIFVVSFFVFIPMTVKELTYNRFYTRIAVFSGFLLLPINHFAAHMQIHTTSQAVMFGPVLLYFFIRVFRRPDWRVAILFITTSAMFILLHLQQAANYALFFGTIAGLQVIHTRYRHRFSFEPKKSMYALLLVFIGLWWLWVHNLAIFERALSSVVIGIFTETTAAESVRTRGVSLEILGGSYEEIFFKLFFVAAIFCLLASFLMLVILLNAANVSKWRSLQNHMLSNSSDQRSIFLYFTIGFAAVSSLFFLYLGLGISDQYFRHYAFMMGIVTVLGVVTIGRLVESGTDYLSTVTVNRTLIVVFGLLLLLSIPVIFSSPWIYQDSNHVTQSSFEGYETHLDYSDELSYVHVRSSASRYSSGIISRVAGPDISTESLPDHFADRQLRTHLDEPSYLGIPEGDRILDADLYQGFRFSHGDFEYVENEVGINKIQSNGGFEMFLIDPA